MFLGRVVRYLVGEAGVRQFLDIGTGLPTADNTHEVARRAAAGSRIVVAPGLVLITRLRPEAAPFGEPEEIDQFGAVGRKA
jgi:hypothetical protein